MKLIAPFLALLFIYTPVYAGDEIQAADPNVLEKVMIEHIGNSSIYWSCKLGEKKKNTTEPSPLYISKDSAGSSLNCPQPIGCRGTKPYTYSELLDEGSKHQWMGIGKVAIDITAVVGLYWVAGIIQGVVTAGQVVPAAAAAVGGAGASPLAQRFFIDNGTVTGVVQNAAGPVIQSTTKILANETTILKLPVSRVEILRVDGEHVKRVWSFYQSIKERAGQIVTLSLLGGYSLVKIASSAFDMMNPLGEFREANVISWEVFADLKDKRPLIWKNMADSKKRLKKVLCDIDGVYIND